MRARSVAVYVCTYTTFAVEWVAAVVAGGVGARRQGVRTQGDDSLKHESPHLG
eukprot:COSAG01_NODE_48601_length_379_cov_1.960714_1_plen_52_part_10